MPPPSHARSAAGHSLRPNFRKERENYEKVKTSVEAWFASAPGFGNVPEPGPGSSLRSGGGAALRGGSRLRL